jgi:hypothetical protein
MSGVAERVEAVHGDGHGQQKSGPAEQPCSAPVQDGARTPGTLPYMSSAEAVWTTAKPKAALASQDLTAPVLENPTRLKAVPVGSWALP